MTLKKIISYFLLFGFTTTLSAANWLMLQGTQAEGFKRTTPIIWGFIQVNYKHDSGKVVLKNGSNKTPFSLLGPDLASQSGFNIGRGRLGVRGMADSENKINYFVLTAFENSGVTNLGGHGSDVGEFFLDASVTFKHIPYVKVRVGQFKTPGSEEGLRATFASPYIEFTSFINMELLERQIYNVITAGSDFHQGPPASSVSAYRDKGAQLFDTFSLLDNWSLSYAYMYGNGSGIKSSVTPNQGTHYGYLALENSFNKGKGFYTESLKAYIWGQSGNREILVNSGTATQFESNRRDRYGIGVTYYENGLRITSELMVARGMIYAGAKDVDNDPNVSNWEIQQATGYKNEAYGGYFNIQYELLPKKLEVFSRYDQLNRVTNSSVNKRIFKTVTLGTSYRFKGATRLDFNYAFRDATAPSNSGAQTILDSMGSRLMFQVTAFFKN